jgi:hypothetical protein
VLTSGSRRPERALFASWSRVPAGVLFGGLVSFAFRAVRVAAGGLTKDADQYGYGDDHDDHENEQRDYGDGHEIFPSREWCIEIAGRVKPGDLYTTLQHPTTVSSVTTARYALRASLVSVSAEACAREG